MKIIHLKDHTTKTDPRQKPFSLTSSLVALLKRVAEDVTKMAPQRQLEPVLVRVRR